MQNIKNTKMSVMIVPQTVTHGSTTTANLDCKGMGFATINVSLGALAGAGTAPSSIKIYEADDTNTASFTEITALSTGAAVVAASKSVNFYVDRSNGARKRYLRVEVTVPSGSTNSNIPLSVIGFLSRQSADPSGTAGYGSDVVKEV
jgi:hypothetical protein